MCFAFQFAIAELSTESPFAEIGFALPMQSGGDPIFIMTIKTTAGLG
jgi:hypothetical protein